MILDFNPLTIPPPINRLRPINWTTVDPGCNTLNRISRARPLGLIEAVEMVVAVVGSPERNSVWALVRKDEVVPHAIVPVVEIVELVAGRVERVALSIIDGVEVLVGLRVVELVEGPQSEGGILLRRGLGISIEGKSVEVAGIWKPFKRRPVVSIVEGMLSGDGTGEGEVESEKLEPHGCCCDCCWRDYLTSLCED